MARAPRKPPRSKPLLTVTVVPSVTAANELCNTHNVFRCEKIHFVTYN